MPQTSPNPSQPQQQTPDAEATPDVVKAAPEGPVAVTPKAVEMVKQTRQQEGIDASYGLRVAVRGGGCSGFEYALDFEEGARENDVVLEYDGLTVYVDPLSARYLKGTVIDYVFGMEGAGFKFRNPNAVGTCGCGSSFAV